MAEAESCVETINGISEVSPLSGERTDLGVRVDIHAFALAFELLEKSPDARQAASRVATVEAEEDARDVAPGIDLGDRVGKAEDARLHLAIHLGEHIEALALPEARVALLENGKDPDDVLARVAFCIREEQDARKERN